jgi:NADPH-dependent glutamate synthase beta subunit-like oxidoreductase
MFSSCDVYASDLYSSSQEMCHDFSKWQKAFESYFKSYNADLFDHYCHIIKEKKDCPLEFLVPIAEILDDFLEEIFNPHSCFVKKNNKKQEALFLKERYTFRRDVIQRRILKSPFVKDVLAGVMPHEPFGETKECLDTQFIGLYDTMTKMQGVEKELEEKRLFIYASWATLTKEGRMRHKDSLIFHTPFPMDPQRLINDEEAMTLRAREADFTWSGPKMDAKKAVMESHYCILCHEKGKDSCRSGLMDPKSGVIKKDSFDKPLEGCPLDQKISQMHALYRQKKIKGALAIICLDNPLAALTGYRICNACEKSCIYQKQTPVDTPSVESEILHHTVFESPNGFDLYYLLTRWNPLNTVFLIPKPLNGLSIAVVGQGPAGLACAHALCREGFYVDGFDALPIPPSPLNRKSVRYTKELDIQGFGGVSNYGITARWNKEWLKVVYALMMRWAHYRAHGHVRLGTSITTDQLFKHGYKHIVLALGAGQPRVLDIPNALSTHIRFASDFLMHLHSQKPFENPHATLTLRLPILVIGGGLSAVDAATESLTYYECMAIKAFQQWRGFSKDHKKTILQPLTLLESRDFIKIIRHGAILQKIHDPLKRRKKLLTLGGGQGVCQIIYRKDITQAPSYQINHYELQKALEEGIQILPNFTPKRFLKNSDGYVKALIVQTPKGVEHTLAAGSVFFACGTTPYKGLLYDEPHLSTKDTLKLQNPEGFAITAHERIHIIGDLHPTYQGSVVHALASGKKVAKAIAAYEEEQKTPETVHDPLDKTEQGFGMKPCLSPVCEISALSTVMDMYKKNGFLFLTLSLKTPLNHKAGYIYRIQRPSAPHPIPLTAYKKEKDTLYFIIDITRGPRTRALRTLQNGDTLLVMPSGEAFPNHKGQHVAFLSESQGHFTSLAFLSHMHPQGGQIFYGILENEALRYYGLIHDCLPQTFPNCNISIKKAPLIHLLKRWSLEKIDSFYVFGSPDFLSDVTKGMESLNQKRPKNLLPPPQTHIFQPMQCMMKGVCSQCLHRKKDGSYVYACAKRSHGLNTLDYASIKERSRQNYLLEVLQNTHLTK